MSHSCSCSCGSVSLLEISKQEALKSCKICGGRPSVKDRNYTSRNMVGTVELEPAAAANFHLNWVITPEVKSRQRAPRRRRKLFTFDNKMLGVDKISKERDDLVFKHSKKGEMSVSESEKLGVTILGRRFCDPIQKVPIKKRRFLQLLSPSTSPRSYSHLLEESRSLPSGDGGMAEVNLVLPEINSDDKTNRDLEGYLVDKSNQWVITKKPCGGADFSGISILAAAACSSEVGDDIMHTEISDTRDREHEISCLSFEKAESHGLLEEKSVEEQLSKRNVSNDKINMPFTRITTTLPKEEDVNMVETKVLQEQVRNSQNIFASSNKTLCESWSSSRNEKFDWDLNKALDVWECPNSDRIDSEHPSVVDSCNNDICAEVLGSCPIQVGFGATSMLDDPVELDCLPKNAEMCFEGLVKQDSSPDSSNIIGHVAGDNLSVASSDYSGKQEKHFVSSDTFEVDEDRNASNGARDVCIGLGVTVPDEQTQSHSKKPGVSHIERDTDFVNFGARAATKILLGNACTEFASDQAELPLGISCSAKETVSKDMDVPAANVINKSDDIPAINTFAEGAAGMGEKGVSVQDINSIFDKPATDKISVVPLNPIMFENVTSGAEDVGEHFEKDSAWQNLAKEVVGSPHKLDPFYCMSHDSSTLEKLNSASSATKEPDSSTEMQVQLHKNSGGVDINRIPNINSIQNESRGVADNLVNTVATMVDERTGLDAATLDPVHPTDASVTLKTSREHPSEDHFDSEYDSVSSQSDTEQHIELEKVEPPGDDGSQYEDGEFREESLLHDWVLDECEEGEAEHVDYGSDNRHSDVLEASVSHVSSSFLIHADGSEYQSERSLGSGKIHIDGGRVSKDFTDAVSKHYQSSNIEPGTVTGSIEKVAREHSRRRDVTEKFTGRINESTEIGACSRNSLDSEHIVEGVDGAKELSFSAYLKMKSSGWDRLPDRSKATGGAVTDIRAESSKKNQVGASGRFVPSESRRNTGDSSQRTYLSSRIERPIKPEISHRKDGVYFGGKRDDGRVTSIRRDGSSLRRHERRGKESETWEGSPHRGQSQRKSPGGYDSSGINDSGLMNAAEAASVKVDNNDFVISSDGTLTEPSHPESTTQVSRQNVDTSSKVAQHSLIGRDEALDHDRPSDVGSVRESSPNRRGSTTRGRSDRYPRMIATGHGERYTRPLSGESFDSSLLVHHPFSRRDSPQRVSVHISKTQPKSRSRSRTRSPHAWTSVRRKSDGGMNGARQWNRSPPNFRSTSRGERMRLSHQQTSFLERMPDFVMSSRTHVSPPHRPRWIDERKGFPDHFRETEYRRSSGRSPSRLFSRNHRLDMNNDRIKAEEYHRTINPDRFREYAIGRRPRFDGRNDRRGHGTRYEMLSSPPRQFDIDDDMKHLSYDDDSFRLNNSRYKTGLEYVGRGNPRAFDRGTEDQIDSPPRRLRDEGRRFHYGREVRQRGSFRSFSPRM